MTNDLAVRVGVVAVDEALEREFEARLADSSTLAFRVAYSVLRRREDTEDVAQEALAKAYKGFRTLRDRDRFRAWLVRTTWRLALDRRRNDRRRQARDDNTDVPLADSAEQAVLALERSRQLWAAIDALPETLRVVMVLARSKDMTSRRSRSCWPYRPEPSNRDCSRSKPMKNNRAR